MVLPFLFLLLALSWAAFGIVCRKQSKEIARLRLNHKKIVEEEHELQEFLHRLEESFSSDMRPIKLHRLIVDGTVGIFKAHGGALYLPDRTGRRLLPAHLSKNCPPLVAVPPAVSLQAESNPMALEGFLRMQIIEADQGPLGRAWSARQSLLASASDDSAALDDLKDNVPRPRSVMLIPLDYSGHLMGLLAVVNGPSGRTFTTKDMDAFASIAEHSAFALYNINIHAQAGEKVKIDADLALAHEVQRLLLPERSPDIRGFEISGINIPARHVSGDYYDYIKIDERRFGVVIADVSGKGVPASLVMATCRSAMRSLAPGQTSPSSVLRQVNRQMFPDIREDMFISMAYLILDQEQRNVVLSRAGHDAPLLYRASDQRVARINPPGMAIGADDGDVFDRMSKEFTIQLETGDCILLYTDGVTEATNDIGNEFGVDKMVNVLQRYAPAGSKAIIQGLTGEVRDFIGDLRQQDDITVIAIRKL